jgi:DNA-binding response OmpR family regulator
MAFIIIADDDGFAVEVIRAALQRGGHVVGALADGEDVGRVVELKRPHLVILDCAMPGKSGNDALRDIRMSATSYRTPVLMLTALTHRRDEEISLRAGANEYMRKPFDPDRLLGIVDVMLSKAAAAH